MRNNEALTLLIAISVAAIGFLTKAVPAFAASKEQVLYSFCSANDCTDGEMPYGGLVFDDGGNLYGTARGGIHGKGVIFELTPGADGRWTDTVLYNFCSLSGCADGAGPGYGSLIFDAAGNLYGTTTIGGTGSCGGEGCGTVFELSPNGDGTWTETVLHSFDDNGRDGQEPIAGLTFDVAGNLYGTTFGGGASKNRTCAGGCGAVFELVPSDSGTWTEKVLHHFCSVHGCTDGHNPLAGVILGKKGSLYGTTSLGGSHGGGCGSVGCGVVFELTPGADDKWNERALHSFSTYQGSRTDLIFDASGNLYGTTNFVVFELQKKNAWAEKVLHKANSASTLVFDTIGNLYGTTPQGGEGYGTAFELKHSKNGKWTQKTLHTFNNNGLDGITPADGLVFDSAGNLYGTTVGGGGSGCGGSGCGTVFEITP